MMLMAPPISTPRKPMPICNNSTFAPAPHLHLWILNTRGPSTGTFPTSHQFLNLSISCTHCTPHIQTSFHYFGRSAHTSSGPSPLRSWRPINTSPRYCSPPSMACAPGTQPSASKESSELGKPLAPPSCSSSSPPSSTLTLFSPLNPTCPWQQQSKTLTSSSKMPPTMSEPNTAVSSPTTSRSALNST